MTLLARHLRIGNSRILATRTRISALFQGHVGVSAGQSEGAVS